MLPPASIHPPTVTLARGYLTRTQPCASPVQRTIMQPSIYYQLFPPRFFFFLFIFSIPPFFSLSCFCPLFSLSRLLLSASVFFTPLYCCTLTVPRAGPGAAAAQPPAPPPSVLLAPLAPSTRFATFFSFLPLSL